MVKNFSIVSNVCSAILKYTLYALVFLMPIFFLPWTSDAIDFNKQAILVFLSVIAFFCWMIKTLISGNFNLNKSIIHIIFGVFLAVSLLSAAFSVLRHGSFWGWPQVASESFLSLACLFVVYFLASNFSKKEILSFLNILFVSALITQIYGILQLCGLYILPLNFAKSMAFNTLGSAGSLAFFSAALLPLSIILLISETGWKKLFFAAQIFLAFAIFAMVNYPFIWWIVLAGTALIVIFGAIKRELFDVRWMFLPIFFVAISLLFLIFNPQIKWIPHGNIEIFLSARTTLGIDFGALKQMPVLGSGPGTFGYDFAKFKDRGFNNNFLWNASFNGGYSKILTSLATTGILGVMAFLVLILTVVFYAARSLIFNEAPQEKTGVSSFMLLLGMGSAFAAQTVGYFLHGSNLALDFIYFFILALIVSLVFKNSKNFALKPSSILTLAVTIFFTLIFIFGFGILFLEGQRYAAQVSYSGGVALMQKGDFDNGLKKVEWAASTNSSMDLYFRELSQAYLLLIQKVSTDENLSKEEASNKVQIYVANAINASKLATDLNKNEISNWASRAAVYQNLAGVVKDSEDWAIKSYDQAISLDPVNPYWHLQQGNVYLVKAIGLKEGQSQEKNKILGQAKEKFNKAIDLKKDYALGYFQMALAAREEGKTGEEEAAISSAEKYIGNDAGLSLQIGLLHYQDSEWQKAQKNFETALALSPSYANALYYLGLTYDKRGQSDNAIKAFTRLSDDNPDNKNLKKILENLKGGRPALDGLSQQPPAPNPSTTNPPPAVSPSPTPSPAATPKK